MSEDELKNEMKRLGLADVGSSSFNFEFPIPKLRLSKANFNFIIENKHFEMRDQEFLLHGRYSFH